jgi:ABC-2 type transport system ATP-binding protein
MPGSSIEIRDISKSFNGTKVVDGISFSVTPGELFGLIGPNGAGKTTTIRMMMDIIKPDYGEIKVFGDKLREETKNNLGYLPEERGLYNKLSVQRVLNYLATLKGMESKQARRQADALLERIGLEGQRTKKVGELSRGMGQIVQFLVAIIHSPKLIILDEPFANLDPVNTELLKEIIFELKSRGCAIILSTHRMNEVEELCDRILMINRGRAVLYGSINDIKERFRSNSILLEYEGELGLIGGVTVKRGEDRIAELILEKETTAQQVLEQLVKAGIKVIRYEIYTPPLNDIFLQVVGEEDE